MTEQEKDEFIKKVRGKKIRAKVWGINEYFIPDGSSHEDAFYGDFVDINGYHHNCTLYVCGGLVENGGPWEFVPEEDQLESKSENPLSVKLIKTVITHVKIQIKGQEITLTLDEAMQLKNHLNGL